MRKKIVTEEMKDYILKNTGKISGKRIAENLNISKDKVYRFQREKGITVTKEQSRKFASESRKKYTTATKEEDNFIKENYLDLPVKRIATILGRTGNFIDKRIERMGLSIPRHIIEQRKEESRFNKGSISFNKGKKQEEYMTPEAIEKTKKTRFKKGNIPHNTNYDGHERISKDGYIEVRIKRGRYKLKHIVEWEKVNGKVPKSHCLRCLDGNQLNTDPDNWELITRIENMYRNSKHNFPEEIIPSLVLNRKIENKINSIQNG